MRARVYIVKGIARHFTGDCEISIVGVRAEKKAAQEFGHEWVKDQAEYFKAEGKNVHPSYELVERDCPDIPGLTLNQRMVLSYILASVKDDLSFDEVSGDFRDNGGILVSLSKEEFQTLNSINL